jgi:hypothetical protein
MVAGEKLGHMPGSNSQPCGLSPRPNHYTRDRTHRACTAVLAILTSLDIENNVDDANFLQDSSKTQYKQTLGTYTGHVQTHGYACAHTHRDKNTGYVQTHTGTRTLGMCRHTNTEHLCLWHATGYGSCRSAKLASLYKRSQSDLSAVQ